MAKLQIEVGETRINFSNPGGDCTYVFVSGTDEMHDECVFATLPDLLGALAKAISAWGFQCSLEDRRAIDAFCMAWAKRERDERDTPAQARLRLSLQTVIKEYEDIPRG